MSAAPPPPQPHPLGDVLALAAGAADRAGAIWRLAESGRQLDANLVRLPPDETVGTHREPDLDVLLLVVDGSGGVDAADGRTDLAPGTLVWLPRGSTRSVAAGGEGLVYLTVHTRRPGMRIGRR